MNTSTSYSLELTGLDGANPLGFLAAVGTLVVVRASGEPGARLRWRRGRTWIPVLDDLTDATRPGLCQKLHGGLLGITVEPELATLCEEKDREHREARTNVKKARQELRDRKLRGKARKEEEERHVAPLVAEADRLRREWLQLLERAVRRPELALGKRIDCTAGEYREHANRFLGLGNNAGYEALDYLAAFGSDACVEEGEEEFDDRRIKATPFCFIRGSGNQYFLDTVSKLLEKVSQKHVERTLFEPWTYQDPGLSMRWDPVEDKRYALNDRKPADDGAKTVWMANLLAYRSLQLFPCVPTSEGLGTTGWARLGKDDVFTWPLWEFLATPETVRTMLQFRELHLDRPDRLLLSKRGITAIFRTRRIRVPPTGSSFKLNFAPARQV